MPTWSEKSKRQAVETRRQNAQRDLIGRCYSVPNLEHLRHAGEVIVIIEVIRPGYLWYARSPDGKMFEVHTDWLKSVCTEVC